MKAFPITYTTSCVMITRAKTTFIETEQQESKPQLETDQKDHQTNKLEVAGNSKSENKVM